MLFLLPAVMVAQEGGYYRIEVGFIKTTHITFPAKVKYIDLGSNYLIAGLADETANVVRVKAGYKGFKDETNFSVICEDGSFYTFLVTYKDQPGVLFHEMGKGLSVSGEDGQDKGHEVMLRDIDGESPGLFGMVIRTLYVRNDRDITHLGERKDKMEATVRGIYVHNDILYLNLSMRNKSHVSYDIDYIRFTVEDSRKLRRTASQKSVITPVREYNAGRAAKVIPGTSYRTIMAFRKFTINADKVLVVEVAEKNGGRNMRFVINAGDIIGAFPVKNVIL